MPDDREPADLVAEALLACPAVAALGEGGLVATFLPGRRVDGVRVDDDVCEVAVAVRSDGRPIPEIADDVRRAAAAVLDDRRVDVYVVDLVTDEDQGADAPPADRAPDEEKA